MPTRDTTFETPFESPWRITCIGAGIAEQVSGALRLTLPATDAGAYHDAQLTDYAASRDFRWQPPVRLEVVSRCVVDGEAPRDFPLVGTAGFGFWNHPFMEGLRGHILPQAAWFFFSAPPSNMQLAHGVGGAGWKAATLDAKRWPFLALAPTAPLGIPLMRVPFFYRHLWPIGQRALGVSEKLLESRLLLERHTYTLDWQSDGLRFAVDGVTVHQTPTAPRGQLGFIAWVDNQYAVVTPQGHFGSGVVAVPRAQSLLLERVSISSL
ncbi:MAG: hypothetical protein LCI00_29005 [Chloroflexi bacterium]|nr:hypothetical protein [Chloroflexota bacterium]